MKGLGAMLLATVLLLAAAASDPVLARGGRGGGGSHASSGHAGGARSSASHVKSGNAGGRHGSRGHFHRGHGGNHFGVFFGLPLIFPSWYFYPPAPVGYYYDDAMAYAAPAAPAQYVEQDTVPAEQQPYYWYYCAESKTYYPYVETCPGGWQTVTPHMPSAAAAPSPNF